MVADSRALLAAGNNADLYEMMFRSWRLRYTKCDYAFVGADHPPPYYSNLMVLAEGCQDKVVEELRSLSQSIGDEIGFKDSFSEYDLQDAGFDTLFRASWIWRPPAGHSPSAWSVVENPSELRDWEAAWKSSGSPTDEHMFRDALLEYEAVRFLFKKDGDDILAGCICNLSTDCVGVSNIFAAHETGTTFAEATAAVAGLIPAKAIVGYARGAHLAAARDAGFEVTGDLRVLIAEYATL
jgi:hypothetical protein